MGPDGNAGRFTDGRGRVSDESRRRWMVAAETPLQHGSRYGYLVEAAGPFPDPRSPFQPGGVHALSQEVDHGTFRWTDEGWQAPPVEAAVIYELHIGTFTSEGTSTAAVGRLPNLVDLGITHVELMPVAEFQVPVAGAMTVSTSSRRITRMAARRT